MYWSIRRELWENRFVYLVPLAAGALFVIGFLINLIRMRSHMRTAAWTHETFAIPYEIVAALVMGSGLLVGLYYSIDALYGERRDRSILFWKSLPVSDVTAVLSKLIIPLVFIPLLSYLITIAAQLLMLLLSSVVLLGSGVDISTVWTQSGFLQASGIMFYHIVTVHGLWYAPIYGWLLLVSAWSPRAPLIWAVLPPFVICGVEKVAFNTEHFLALVEERFLGPETHGVTLPGSGPPMHSMSTLIPDNFFGQPGLWIGLAVAVVFIAAAVRLRRYRGPI
jgi:ABC-2 type transport system permease protein